MGLVSIFIRTHFLAFNGFQSALHHPPPPDTTMIPRRRRLLFTLGTLLLSFLQNLSTRIHISTLTPKGKNTKIVCAIEHQFLTILSFFDDHIMVFQDLTETLFPSSSRVFDKIDEFVRSSESLPLKFEDFMDNDVPKIMQRVPFLDRFFHKDEKEIVIDITCHGYRIEPENVSQDDVVNTTSDSEISGKEEVVEKWSEEEDDDDDDDLKKEKFKDMEEEGNGETLYSAKADISNEDFLRSEDPIYELFEAGWHMSPRALSSPTSLLKD